MCDNKKCNTSKEADSKVNDILDEVLSELGCWECWHQGQDDDAPAEDCDCQTCQMIQMYNKLVDIAEK